MTATARDGTGVARGEDGRVVFVEGALPGESVIVEIVQVDRRWSRGRVVRILEPSRHRVVVSCEHQVNGCGGCDLLHVNPDAQLTMKTSMAIDQLARVGLDAPDPSMRSLTQDHGRTTIRAAVKAGRAGYRGRSSHDVVIPEACVAVDPLAEELLVAGRFPGANTVTIRVGNRTGERLVVVDRAPLSVEVPDDVLVVGQADLAARKRAWIHEEIVGQRVRISANSFFQNRPAGADALVAEVGRMLSKTEPGLLIDAYSGVGLFSVTVGRHRPVVAIERNRDAVADARVNVQGREVKVICSSIENWRPSRAVAVIANPGRKGLGKRGAEALCRAEPKTFVLVSCDPSAFGRDAARLIAAGFTMDEWTVIDMFPGTSHVETVARFSS